MELVSQPIDQHHVTGTRPENVWSTIRHHTTSWLLLWRLLVLAVGLATLVGAATFLMWLLGMRIGIAGFEVGPAV